MVRLIFIEKVFSVYFSHAIENDSIVTIPLSIASWIFAEISSGNLHCVAIDMFVHKSDILLKTYGLNFLGELFEAVTDMNQCWIVWFSKKWGNFFLDVQHVIFDSILENLNLSMQLDRPICE